MHIFYWIGIHGFWREYKNTFDIMNRIEGVHVDQVLGDFSPSVLWSKNGKVAVAPVLLEDEDNVYFYKYLVVSGELKKAKDH